MNQLRKEFRLSTKFHVKMINFNMKILLILVLNCVVFSKISGYRRQSEFRGLSKDQLSNDIDELSTDLRIKRDVHEPSLQFEDDVSRSPRRKRAVIFKKNKIFYRRRKKKLQRKAKIRKSLLKRGKFTTATPYSRMRKYMKGKGKIVKPPGLKYRKKYRFNRFKKTQDVAFDPGAIPGAPGHAHVKTQPKNRQQKVGIKDCDFVRREAARKKANMAAKKDRKPRAGDRKLRPDRTTARLSKVDYYDSKSDDYDDFDKSFAARRKTPKPSQRKGITKERRGSKTSKKIERKRTTMSGFRDSDYDSVDDDNSLLPDEDQLTDVSSDLSAVHYSDLEKQPKPRKTASSSEYGQYSFDEDDSAIVRLATEKYDDESATKRVTSSKKSTIIKYEKYDNIIDDLEASMKRMSKKEKSKKGAGKDDSLIEYDYDDDTDIGLAKKIPLAPTSKQEQEAKAKSKKLEPKKAIEDSYDESDEFDYYSEEKTTPLRRIPTKKGITGTTKEKLYEEYTDESSQKRSTRRRTTPRKGSKFTPPTKFIPKKKPTIKGSVEYDSEEFASEYFDSLESETDSSDNEKLLAGSDSDRKSSDTETDYYSNYYSSSNETEDSSDYASPNETAVYSDYASSNGTDHSTSYEADYSNHGDYSTSDKTDYHPSTLQKSKKRSSITETTSKRRTVKSTQSSTITPSDDPQNKPSPRKSKKSSHKIDQKTIREHITTSIEDLKTTSPTETSPTKKSTHKKAQKASEGHDEETYHSSDISHKISPTELVTTSKKLSKPTTQQSTQKQTIKSKKDHSTDSETYSIDKETYEYSSDEISNKQSPPKQVPSKKASTGVSKYKRGFTTFSTKLFDTDEALRKISLKKNITKKHKFVYNSKKNAYELVQIDSIPPATHVTTSNQEPSKKTPAIQVDPQTSADHSQTILHSTAADHSEESQVPQKTTKKPIRRRKTTPGMESSSSTHDSDHSPSSALPSDGKTTTTRLRRTKTAAIEQDDNPAESSHHQDPSHATNEDLPSTKVNRKRAARRKTTEV